jgi:integrase
VSQPFLFGDWPEHRNGQTTVADVVAFYLAHLEFRLATDEINAHTASDMRRELQRFSKSFGGQTVLECKRHDLTRWLQANPQWRSRDTIKRVLATIVGAFRWAEEEEFIPSCPYRMPKKIPGKRGIRCEATVPEYVLLMRKASRPLRRALFFIAHTGVRPCEMRELQVDEIDLERRVIEKQAHKTARFQCRRAMGVDLMMVRFLGNITRKRTGFVFLNGHGQPWRTRHGFDRHFRRWADRLGLRRCLSPYCFRHLFAGDAVDAGIPDRQIADQMGWVTTKMLARYSHAADRPGYMGRIAEDITRKRQLARRRPPAF